MARAMEQSMNPEAVALRKSSTEFPPQLRGGLIGEQSSRPSAVRVVGMDESTNMGGKPVLQDTALGSASSLQANPQIQLPGNAPGQLVLGEGKSQYIPSPFWASMGEVRIALKTKKAP